MTEQLSGEVGFESADTCPALTLMNVYSCDEGFEDAIESTKGYSLEQSNDILSESLESLKYIVKKTMDEFFIKVSDILKPLEDKEVIKALIMKPLEDEDVLKILKNKAIKLKNKAIKIF